jgi:parallel beta-helix repeat protein
MKKRFRVSKWGVLALLAAFGVGLPNNLLLTKVNAADLDIRQFGANCDGSDDAAAVQQALNALSDGQRLTVSCQVSIGASGISLSRKNDVVVEGVDGGGFVAMAPNKENILFGIEYCDRCVFRMLYIDARNYPVAGLSINYSNNARIEANTIVNVTYNASAAILGLGNRGNLYTWNTISNTSPYIVDGQIVDGTRGIWLGNPRQSLIEWNAVITNNKLTDIGATAIAVNGVGATVTGNYVERSQGAGVKIAPPLGQGGRTFVRDNTLLNNRFSGVQIENADSSVVIQDNVLDQNQIAGVYVSGGNFVDGEISGNRISGSGEAGIYMYDANGVTIQENQILGGKGGLTFESQSGAIQNVRLYNNVVNNLGGNGLVMLGRGGSIRAVTLDSNAFTDIKLYAMALEGGEINNPNLIANCFVNLGAGTLLDTRGSVSLPAPQPNQNCIRPPQSRYRPLRINVGGPVYVDSRRQSWLADDDLVQGHIYKSEGTIANTDDPDLYLKGRWNDHTLDFSAEVPNRAYTVTMKFAETYFSGRGQRVFDIYINGDLVLPNFDILSFARPFEAVDRSFKINVTNGRIDIHMVSHADDPMISAIEIQ